MVKDIINKLARMCNRNDIIFEIESKNSVSSIQDAGVKSDVLFFIELYNEVSKITFETYIELKKKDILCSNTKCEIPYYAFEFMPIKILAVESEKREKVDFEVGATSLKLNSPNLSCVVTYCYSPCEVSDLNDETGYSEIFENLIISGVLSKYFMAKGRITESKKFEEIFLKESFLLNSKRERRLKSTFCLWTINFITFATLT